MGHFHVLPGRAERAVLRTKPPQRRFKRSIGRVGRYGETIDPLRDFRWLWPMKFFELIDWLVPGQPKSRTRPSRSSWTRSGGPLPQTSTSMESRTPIVCPSWGCQIIPFPLCFSVCADQLSSLDRAVLQIGQQVELEPGSTTWPALGPLGKPNELAGNGP